MSNNGRWRSALGAGVTLGVVGGLYGAPIILGAILGILGPLQGFAVSGDVVVQSDREPVVWIPPATDDEDASADAASEEEVASEEPVDPAPAEADPGEMSDAAPAPELAAATGKGPRVKRKRPVRKRRPRRRRVVRTGARIKAPPKELTKKQQRQREKRKRKRERQAKRKQCSELIDQVVQVDEGEWWYGRELVNCYRTHIDQFDNIGGMWWAEDEDGKRIGVKVRLSKSKRGDPGRAAGFETGDVIMSVNRIRIRSMAGAALVSTQLLRGKARVKRLRDGREEVVLLKVVSESKLREKKEEVLAIADTRDED